MLWRLLFHFFLLLYGSFLRFRFLLFLFLGLFLRLWLFGEQLLVEMVLFLIDGSRGLFIRFLSLLEEVLPRLLNLVPLYSFLVEFALPEHLVDVVRVPLQVATDQVLAHEGLVLHYTI